jgi:hypothetical protein
VQRSRPIVNLPREHIDVQRTAVRIRLDQLRAGVQDARFCQGWGSRRQRFFAS